MSCVLRMGYCTEVRDIKLTSTDYTRRYYDCAACICRLADPVSAISLLSNCNYVHGRGPQLIVLRARNVDQIRHEF